MFFSNKVKCRQMHQKQGANTNVGECRWLLFVYNWKNAFVFVLLNKRFSHELSHLITQYSSVNPKSGIIFLRGFLWSYIEANATAVFPFPVNCCFVLEWPGCHHSSKASVVTKVRVNAEIFYSFIFLLYWVWIPYLI